MAFSFTPVILLALPLLEIAVFVLVGSQIGVLATIGLVIATTILGAILLRIQGFGILQRMRSNMEAGASPGRDMVHGLMIMTAGVLLVLPGFITDLVGLLLFIPAVRNVAWSLMKDRIVVSGGLAGGGSRAGGYRRSRSDGRTIDLGDEDFSREGRPDDDRPSLDDRS